MSRCSHSVRRWISVSVSPQASGAMRWMLCSLTFVGTRPWITTHHTESTASAKNAWDKFPHIKYRLIDGNVSIVLLLLLRVSSCEYLQCGMCGIHAPVVCFLLFPNLLGRIIRLFLKQFPRNCSIFGFAAIRWVGGCHEKQAFRAIN